MTGSVLRAQADRFLRHIPAIEPGYTVRVHEKIQEGDKERVQVFEGLVISVHNGHVPTDASFTVRKVVSGVGVEKVFPVHSPAIQKVEVKKVAKTRRAKLFFLRGRTGKAARMSERFTTDDEFQMAVEGEKPAQEMVENQDIVSKEPKTEENKQEATAA